MEFKKITSQRLYEKVLDQLEELLNNGELKPGDRLPPERDLAEQVNVSRGTLREAFRVLEWQGVIETIHGGGRHLRRLPNKKTEEYFRLLENLEKAEIYDLLEAREIFETRIIQLVVERATENDILEIEANLIKRQKDFNLDSDQGFHLAIVRASHNVVFYNIMELNLELLSKIRGKTLKSPLNIKQMRKEHEDIFEAIRDRDAEAAQNALMRHLKNIRERL